MGTFGGYYGSMNIPEDKREIFSKQMEKILNYGGMMAVEDVCIYGIDIELLVPFDLSLDEKICFYFNYFEDRPWETAEYDKINARLYSEKIGGHEFDDVMMAAYSLYEVYDKDYGYAILNGDMLGDSYYIGWINNLLGTSHSMEKRSEIWKYIERHASIMVSRGYEDPVDIKNIRYMIPEEKWDASGGLDLADLLYIIYGTGSLEEDDVKEGTYPGDVLMCRRIIEKLLSEGHTENKNLILELIKKPYDDRKNESSTLLKPLAEASLFMPARVLCYLTAEICNEKFWVIWEDIKDMVYTDEKLKEYASKELVDYRKKTWKEPIPPVATSDFLYQKPWSLFERDDPEEVKALPEYHVSDADRLFWWDGSDEVKITEETDRWIKSLAERHKQLLERPMPKDTEVDFLKRFINLLDEICEYYIRIFAFRDMFYDFLEHSGKREYTAAVELLKELADSDENRKTGSMIKYAEKRDWDCCNRKVTFNQARLQLKRYLSIMANKKLRMSYFGF